MNTFVTVNEKIAALIPRLGSDSDGEIIATVKAIGCQLKMVGSKPPGRVDKCVGVSPAERLTDERRRSGHRISRVDPFPRVGGRGWGVL